MKIVLKLKEETLTIYPVLMSPLWKLKCKDSVSSSNKNQRAQEENETEVKHEGDKLMTTGTTISLTTDNEDIEVQSE